MRINGRALRTIWFEDDKVKIIDQNFRINSSLKI